MGPIDYADPIKLHRRVFGASWVEIEKGKKSGFVLTVFGVCLSAMWPLGVARPAAVVTWLLLSALQLAAAVFVGVAPVLFPGGLADHGYGYVDAYLVTVLVLVGFSARERRR